MANNYTTMPLDEQITILQQERANLGLLWVKGQMWQKAQAELEKAGENIGRETDQIEPAWEDDNGLGWVARARTARRSVDTWAHNLKQNDPEKLFLQIRDLIPKALDLAQQNKTLMEKDWAQRSLNPTGPGISKAELEQTFSAPSGKVMNELADLYEQASRAVKDATSGGLFGEPPGDVQRIPGGGGGGGGLPAGGGGGLPAGGAGGGGLPGGGTGIDPNTGLPQGGTGIDPITGLPSGGTAGGGVPGGGSTGIDPVTGLPIDPVTGLPVGSDPSTGGANPELSGGLGGGAPITAPSLSSGLPGGGTGLPTTGGTGMPILPVGGGGGGSTRPITGGTGPGGTGINPITGLPGGGTGINPITGLPGTGTNPNTGLPGGGSGINPITGLPSGTNGGPGAGAGVKLPGVSLGGGGGGAGLGPIGGGLGGGTGGNTTIPAAATPYQAPAAAGPSGAAPTAPPPAGAAATASSTGAGMGGVPPMMPPMGMGGGAGSGGGPGSGAASRPGSNKNRRKEVVTPGLPVMLSGKAGMADMNAFAGRGRKQVVESDVPTTVQLIDEDLWQVEQKQVDEPVVAPVRRAH
jgi:hypothetical protein